MSTASDPSALSPLDVQELVSLKALLREATLASHKQSPIYRILGLVMLDACNERAMNVAVRFLVLDYSDFQNFDGMKSALQSQLDSSWRPQSWRDVRRLHNARNMAQHHSIPASRESMPLWRTATEQFVRSVIKAVFQVRLDDIRYASAVRDEELRREIEDAENELECDRLSNAQEGAYRAYDLAQRQWERATVRIRRVRQARKPMRSQIPRDEFSRWITDRVESLDSSSSEVRFSSNAPDLEWFLRTRREGQGHLDKDEVGRLMGFVFQTIVEWEAIADDLAIDWQMRSMIMERKVRQEGEHAYAEDVSVKIARYNVGTDLHEERLLLTVPIANVPQEKDFEIWANLALQRIQALRQFSRSNIKDSGVLTLEIEPEDVDMDAAMTHVHDSIRRAEQDLSEVLEREHEAESSRNLERIDFNSWVAGQDFPWWVKKIELIYYPDDRQNVVAIDVAETLFWREFEETVRDVIRAPTRWYRKNGALLLSGTLPKRDTLVTQLEEISTRVNQQIASRAERRATARARLDPLDNSARAALERTRPPQG